jgi:hypothetical protein
MMHILRGALTSCDPEGCSAFTVHHVALTTPAALLHAPTPGALHRCTPYLQARVLVRPGEKGLQAALVHPGDHLRARMPGSGGCSDGRPA